jgi:regulator of sigma E protease
VSLIPLGGYVRLAGDEADENRVGAPEEFLARPRYQRLAVFLAGATFNLLLAFGTMWMFFAVYGKEEVPQGYPAVYAVAPGSTAEQAGIAPGDVIVALDGRDVRDAEVFLEQYLLRVKLSPGQVLPVRIERAGETLDVRLDTGVDARDGSGEPGWSFTWEGSQPAVIEQVFGGEPAEVAGLRPGDRIVGAAGHEPLDRIQLQLRLLASPGRPVELTVERDGARLPLTVVPREKDGTGWIGISFRRPPAVRSELTLLGAAAESFRTNVAWSKMLFVTLKRLVTREVSLKTMSGPIGIAQFARQALIAGPEAFFWLLGFVSLQLGILNLLPIPVLDGGHLLILGVESVMRRDLSDRLKERVTQAGFVFLLAFMGIVVYLDIVKSF